ncbi:ATP-dependent helicase/deoxyribonuclease subunit B [bacterium HR37]|nr:ATP-dependent helicase/deoxyribonuclease subunit B [bacterium HR37]
MMLYEVPSGCGLREVLEWEGGDLKDESLFFIFPDVPALSRAERLFVKHGLWGNRLLTFGKLAFLLNRDMLVRLSRVGRLFLMEEVVEELADTFTYFKEPLIRGFSGSLVRLIAEFKHLKLTPDCLRGLAEKIEEDVLKKKLIDLAGVFECYQKRLLGEGLVDDIDELVLLSESIRNGRLGDVFPEAKRFFVFGFPDLTLTQVEVLKSIEERGYELRVFVPDLSGFSTLRRRLSRKLGINPEDIRRLSRTSFRQRSVEIRSFPSFSEEVDFVSKEIKRLILEKGVRADEICVVLRSFSEKAKDIVSGFDKLGISYWVSRGISLKESLLGQFVMDLLEVKLSGFERKRFSNLLRSPFLSEFFKDTHCLESVVLELENKARERKFRGGVREWLALLEEANLPAGFSESVRNLISLLNERLNSGTLKGFCSDLIALLDTLGVHIAVRRVSSLHRIHLFAWEELSALLRELRFLSNMGFGKAISPEECLFLLKDVFSEARFYLRSSEEERGVYVVEAFDLRGADFPFVFLLDVSERSFPMQFVQDAVLKDTERKVINRFMDGDFLLVEDVHYQDEELLFKLVCSSAKSYLWITYSQVDSRERAMLPSYLVEEIAEEEGWAIKKETLKDRLLRAENIYTVYDLARYLFFTDSYGEGELSEFLRKHWPQYERVVSGVAAEKERLRNRGDFSGFEGVVKDISLFKELSLSPTGLETYGRCPFRYFASRVLGLKGLPEYEEDVSVLDTGGFYHRVLGDFFKALSSEMDGRIDLRTVGDYELLQKFRCFAEGIDFSGEFGWLSPGIRELLRVKMLEEVLPTFILKEAGRIREWNSKGFFPVSFEREVSFEFEGIRLRGVIDRVDIGDKGALVIDYKLGSPNTKRFCNPLHLQLPLYLFALKQEGITPYGGYYRFIEKPDEERGESESGKGNIDAQIESALSYLRLYSSLIRQGFFAPVIEDKKACIDGLEVELRKDDYSTCGWCEFKDLCRVHGGVIRRYGG